MDEVVSAIEAPTPAAPPPAAPPDLSSEIREIHSMLDGMRQSNEPDIPALRDADSGRSKPVYSGAHDAGRHLARRRREAAAADPSSAPPEPSGVDLEIGYVDGRESVDAKTAARDLADYRARMAAQLLEGVDPTTAAVRASGVQQEAPVAEQPAEPQPQAEQPQPEFYSRAQVEQAAVEQLQNYSERIGAILMAIRGQGIPPELQAVSTPEAFAALKVQDPAKALALTNYVQNRVAMTQQLESELREAGQQREQIQSIQFQRFALEQDELFERAVPEIRGEGSRELQHAAFAVLRDVGLSEDEIKAAWSGGAMISLRDHRAQRIVADAARWRIAQAKAKTAIAKSTPPPQRPGMRQDVRASVADLHNLSRQLDEAGSAQQQLKLAGRLVAERRRAQG
jgi:hypothetical protein